MQRMSFTPENKNASFGDYPKLKLKKDERARVLCLEEPTFAYSHGLRAPVIVNGKVKMEQVKRGEEVVEQYAMDFLGQPLCFGDLGILQDKGIDPKNCPACEMAQTSDMVPLPQRRFAMHVIRYATKQGSFEPAAPLSVQLVVWAYQDKVFNKLTDIVTEWGNLQNHDLLLGPCTVEMYQTFDIGVAAKAAWMLSKESQMLVVQTYKENQTKDLESFCGRKVDVKWMKEDLERIKARWRVVNGQTDVGGTAEATSELMAEHPGGMDEFAPKTPPADETPAASLFAENTPASVIAAATAKTTEVGTKAEDFIADKSTVTPNGVPDTGTDPAADAPVTQSFDELLKSFGDS